jgi:hypothetical protein
VAATTKKAARYGGLQREKPASSEAGFLFVCTLRLWCDV